MLDYPAPGHLLPVLLKDTDKGAAAGRSTSDITKASAEKSLTLGSIAKLENKTRMTAAAESACTDLEADAHSNRTGRKISVKHEPVDWQRGSDCCEGAHVRLSDGGVVIEAMRWGLVPSYSEAESVVEAVKVVSSWN